VDSDLLETFTRYARAAGAEVRVVGDERGAAEAILSCTAGTLRCSPAILAAYPGLYRALQAAGQPVVIADDIATQPGSRSALAAGLSGGTALVMARAGVAETGSLVLADDALAPRLLSMLSDVCVALLVRRTILAGLDEAGALVCELDRRGHRYVSLVTGPSRTADIERVLTIGVQGPKVLWIIVLTEEGA
jgi:L-lactate dehydrogenase complex protein LldG